MAEEKKEQTNPLFGGDRLYAQNPLLPPVSAQQWREGLGAALDQYKKSGGKALKPEAPAAVAEQPVQPQPPKEVKPANENEKKSAPVVVEMREPAIIAAPIPAVPAVEKVPAKKTENQAREEVRKAVTIFASDNADENKRFQSYLKDLKAELELFKTKVYPGNAQVALAVEKAQSMLGGNVADKINFACFPADGITITDDNNIRKIPLAEFQKGDAKVSASARRVQAASAVIGWFAGSFADFGDYPSKANDTLRDLINVGYKISPNVGGQLERYALGNMSDTAFDQTLTAYQKNRSKKLVMAEGSIEEIVKFRGNKEVVQQRKELESPEIFKAEDVRPALQKGAPRLYERIYEAPLIESVFEQSGSSNSEVTQSRTQKLMNVAISAQELPDVSANKLQEKTA